MKISNPSSHERCTPKCPGWLHMHDPREIQKCDACARFQTDEEAQRAHQEECGCGWSELDPLVAYDKDGARYCLGCADKAGIDTSTRKPGSGFGGPVRASDLEGDESCSKCGSEIR